MNEQGPQFVVAYGGRLYRVQTVETLDANDQEALAILDGAPEPGRAAMLPDLSYKSMGGPEAAANIGNDQQAMSGANIGNEQSMAQPESGANIGDQNFARPQSGANIGNEPDR